jgi:AraC-like DNA-binding protein
VVCLWLGEGQVHYQRDRLLPRGMSFLLFNLGPRQYLVDAAGGGRRPFDDVWFCGQQQGFLETEAPHGTALLGVAFAAAGAYRILGEAQGALSGAVLPLADLLGDGARALRQRLLETSGVRARLELVERWLLVRQEQGRAAHPVTRWAVERIERSAGRLRVEQLAADCGFSRQRVHELFRREVGLGPKVLSRIHRFHRALELLRGCREMPWAQLAAECGYYDQSHLIRDVRAFAGCAPGELLAAPAPDASTLVVA